jgi:hypothetical protein
MIRAGHAWAYRDYLTDKSLLSVEAAAHTARRGLWAMSWNDTMPPWDWRHRPKPARQVTSVPNFSAMPTVSDSGRQCLGKRYCRQMTSCEEARFYLNVCRVDTLDGDDDGIPCEAICGH